VTLTPTFASDTLEYTATTTNATNKVTATPTDDTAEVEILLGETEIENGSSATWAEGENVLTITVTGTTDSTVYTVTVTAE
jgi:hypothetical protein